VHSGIDCRRVDKLIFFKLQQNEEMEGKSLISVGRSFHALGAEIIGNLLRWFLQGNHIFIFISIYLIQQIQNNAKNNSTAEITSDSIE
jgi:hypothetical protein